jgi:hypothetical protein
MKIATMTLSVLCVTNFSLMTSMVKHGFSAQNVEDGVIQSAVETTLLVTAMFVIFAWMDKFLEPC